MKQVIANCSTIWKVSVPYHFPDEMALQWGLLFTFAIMWHLMPVHNPVRHLAHKRIMEKKKKGTKIRHMQQPWDRTAVPAWFSP